MAGRLENGTTVNGNGDENGLNAGESFAFRSANRKPYGVIATARYSWLGFRVVVEKK